MRHSTKIVVVTIAAEVLAIAGVIAILVMADTGWRWVFAVLWILFMLIALVFAVMPITNRQRRELRAMLFDRCDPDSTIREIYASVRPSQYSRLPFDLSMLLYEAHYAQGRYEDALRDLQSTRLRYPGSLGRLYRALWLLNLGEIKHALGRYDESEAALEECRALTQSGNLKPKAQQILLRGIDYERLLLSVRQGNFAGAEEVLHTRLAEATTEYVRVCIHYWLGVVYARQGQEDKAREAWEYAAAHGAAIRFAVLARDALGSEPAADAAHT
jgi:tetratricopeptide (TPR) repeat protein